MSESRRLYAFLFAVFAATSTFTQAAPERPSGWGLGVGTVASTNAISGADSRIIVVPFIFYEGDDVYLRGPIAGWRFWNEGPLSFALNARAEFQSWKASDSPQLTGMANRSMTAEAGLTASYRSEPLVFRAGLWQDVFDNHGGWEGMLSVAYPQRIAPNLFVSPRIQLNWLSSQKSNYYFGVRPGEAAAGRPVYRPGQTYTVGAGVRLQYWIDRNWTVQLNAGLSVLSDELRDSPIVDRSLLPSFILGVLRMF